MDRGYSTKDGCILAEKKFKKRLRKEIPMIENDKFLYITCIGTRKVKFDEIGPRIGSHLKEKLSKLNLKGNVKVLGTIEDNVMALNIYEKLKEIDDKKIELGNKNVFVLAVDACTTADNSKLGKVIIRDGSIIPGKGMGKELKEVGDVSILPITHGGLLITLDSEIQDKLAKNLSNIIYDVIKDKI